MYDYFACRYDELTDNVDYEDRCDYICTFFSEYGLKKNDTVLDLACGTGTMSILLKKRGYNVIGIDSSADMLSVADNKAGGNIPFLKAEMQDFKLTEPVNACVCCLDSINHLENIEEAAKAFQCVYNSLKENGIFVFDINTIYKHNEVLGDNTFVFDKDGYFLSWDNELLDNGRVRILLDFFVFNGSSYDRYSEEFTETAFSITELKCAINPYFDVLGVYDDMTLDEPKSSSERLYFVCKRK